MEITCPYCYNCFDSKDIALRCRSMRCNEEDDQTYMDFWAKRGFSVQPETRHVYTIRRKWWGGEDKSCDVCGAKEYDYVCPHCHNELPQEMVTNGAEIISVIGGPQSGKSHYIVALLQELLDNGFEIGLRATPMQLGKDTSLHTTTKFEEAKRQLNNNLSTLQKTPAGQFSLPWIIRVDSRDPKVRGKQEPKKSIYLVFYDTAGEDFNSPTEIENNAKYLAQSKAVIVLFDTLSIPKIQEILSKDKNVNTLQTENATPFETTWNGLENFIEKGNQHLREKPFAFVLSKFDAVLDHSDDLGFNHAAFMNTQGRIDESYINGQGEFDMRQVTLAHETIVDALSDRNIWNLRKYPKFVDDTWGDNGRFFGVSAIGAMPENDVFIPKGGIKPYRVMDPLLWIMSRLGGFAFKTFNDD